MGEKIGTHMANVNATIKEQIKSIISQFPYAGMSISFLS
jgi:hypothetical protein